MNSTGSSPVDAPPAYSFAQEFDQKLAIAVDESLQSSSNGKRRQEDEETDARDGRDETHARPGSSGRAPLVQPLNFRKKHNRLRSDMPPTKEKPSWLGEAQQSGTSAGNPRRRSLPQHPNGQRVRDDSPRRHVLPPEDKEDRSIPPPPFATIDNSLDGPTYERYPTDDRRRRPGHGQVVMRYEGEDFSASPPPSPLVTPRSQAVSQSSGRGGSQNYHHQTQQLHQGRLTSKAPANRSASPAALFYVPPPPRLNFDPSVAYDNTQSLYAQYSDEPASVAGGAAALYRCVIPRHASRRDDANLTIPSFPPVPPSHLICPPVIRKPHL